MKQKLTILFLAAVMLLSLAACGKAKSSGADPVELGRTMLDKAGDMPDMSVVSSADKDGEALFKYVSDLPYDKVAGYYLAYASSGSAEEIAVIRLKNSSDAAEAKASLERHLKSRLGLFKVYSPDQVASVEGARIVTEGDTIALFVCKNADALSGELQKAMTR